MAARLSHELKMAQPRAGSRPAVEDHQTVKPRHPTCGPARAVAWDRPHPQPATTATRNCPAVSAANSGWLRAARSAGAPPRPRRQWGGAGRGWAWHRRRMPRSSARRARRPDSTRPTRSSSGCDQPSSGSSRMSNGCSRPRAAACAAMTARASCPETLSNPRAEGCRGGAAGGPDGAERTVACRWRPWTRPLTRPWTRPWTRPQAGPFPGGTRTPAPARQARWRPTWFSPGGNGRVPTGRRRR
mmetsp:Transcript_12953/g.42394  ORF Transcript_12953/g.42394 Transcript_12953/m.42394 type:complete len:243 (-) Transcript_12953:392-1120(-)